MTLKPLIQSRSLTDLVTEAIQQAVSNRELRPGTRLTESALAKRLHVSKTPVREAMLRLQFMGVIEPDGARGGRIVMPSARAIAHAYELREGLECQAAKLAALKATPEEAAAIRSLAKDSMVAARAGKVDRFRKADGALHRAIATASDNPRLAEMIENALVLTWTLRLRDVPLADDSLECAKQHESIAEAIVDGDVDRAARAMGDHIQTVQQIVVSAFERSVLPAASAGGG